MMKCQSHYRACPDLIKKGSSGRHQTKGSYSPRGRSKQILEYPYKSPLQEPFSEPFLFQNPHKTPFKEPLWKPQNPPQNLS